MRTGVLSFLVLMLGLAACSSDPLPSSTGSPMVVAGSGGSGSTAGAPASGGAAAPSGAPCAGKPGAIRGKSKQMLMAAGLARDFIYYAPASLVANTPAPVVLIPHGFTMNADMMYEITKYSDLADKENFIAVFLNGQPNAAGPWNVGNPDCSSTAGILPIGSGDDQAYLDAVLNFAEADQCLDRAHIFMTGFSMGGYLANETGCLRPEIRAVAPHSGGTHDLASCKTQHKPVLLMHFQGDALIPYMCGTQARDRWVARNGCSTEAPDVKPVTGGSCEYYKGCPADGQVGFCTFQNPMGMRSEPFPGHAWSGGSKEGPAGGASFAIPETASATELSWSFFKTYAW